MAGVSSADVSAWNVYSRYTDPYKFRDLHRRLEQVTTCPVGIDILVLDSNTGFLYTGTSSPSSRKNEHVKVASLDIRLTRSTCGGCVAVARLRHEIALHTTAKDC